MATNIYRSVNGATASSGGGDSSPFVRTFDATTSWGASSSGLYSIVVAQSLHQKGLTPIVQVFEIVGSNLEEVYVDTIEINSFGDVTIRVTENIDTRFAGKIVIK